MLSPWPRTRQKLGKLQTQDFAPIAPMSAGLNPIAARRSFSANSLPVIRTSPSIRASLFFPARVTSENPRAEIDSNSRALNLQLHRLLLSFNFLTLNF